MASTIKVAECDAFVMTAIRSQHANTVVVVITLRDCLDEVSWELYEQSYRKLYSLYKRFAIVFDGRQMGLPGVDIIVKKLALLKSLKHRSVGQLATAIVLTEYDIIKSLVSQLVQAGGQAAPFEITTGIHDAANLVGCTLEIQAGRKPREQAAGALTFRDLHSSAIVALFLLKLARFSRHILAAFHK